MQERTQKLCDTSFVRGLAPNGVGSSQGHPQVGCCIDTNTVDDLSNRTAGRTGATPSFPAMSARS